MGLFGISNELWFRVCNYREQHTSSCKTRNRAKGIWEGHGKQRDHWRKWELKAEWVFIGWVVAAPHWLKFFQVRWESPSTPCWTLPWSCVMIAPSFGLLTLFWFSSVQFSHLVVSYSLRPHGLQHTRLPCPSPTPRACSNSCPLSWGDAIQPSHPLSSTSPPAFNLFQHQGLFQWVSSSHQVAKVLEFQLQH